MPSNAEIPEEAAIPFIFLSVVHFIAAKAAPPCATLLQAAIASKNDAPEAIN